MADDNSKTADDARTYWAEEGYSPGGVVREVDYKKASQGVHPLFAGIKIVDCDTHFTEPPDLFTSRAPAKYKDKVPYVKRVNGNDRWFMGDKDFGSMGGNVIAADNNKLLGRLAYPNLDQGHPGSYQVKPRLKAMDDMGIWAQICYQNSGVTQGGSLMASGDAELANVIMRIFNDAAAERMEESNQRIFSLASLPYWNRQELMKEARRAIEDLKLKGVTLPDRPERLGVPGYGNVYWEEFFELCSATNTSINFHLNANIDAIGMTWDDFSFEQKLAVGAMMFSIGNAATLGNFMVSGLLDKYPKLKIGLIESGMGWVPFAIEALEHQFDEMLPKKIKELQRRPWEYFRDHFWVTYWFEKTGPQLLLERLGVDKVLFETDFPHPTSLYPGVQEHLVETLGGYDFATRKRVLEQNAVELYNLPF